MKLLVLIPTKDKVNEKTLESLNNQSFKDFSVLINVMEPIQLNEDKEKNRYLNIVRNRNDLREKALKHNVDYYLWVDSDIILPKNAIQELILQDRDIIGGWYKTHTGNEYVAGRWIANNTSVLYKTTQPSLIPIDFMGLGCCLMKRKVLETIEFDAGIDLYQKDERGNIFFNGDCVQFCNAAYDNGFKLWMNGDVVCEHGE